MHTTTAALSLAIEDLYAVYSSWIADFIADPTIEFDFAEVHQVLLDCPDLPVNYLALRDALRVAMRRPAAPRAASQLFWLVARRATPQVRRSAARPLRRSG